MSREIDPDKDWEDYTDDELQYALDRDWFPDEETAQKVKAYLDEGGGEGDGLDKMKVPELRTLAGEEGIDLGDAKKKDDIVAAIREAREAGD